MRSRWSNACVPTLPGPSPPAAACTRSPATCLAFSTAGPVRAAGGVSCPNAATATMPACQSSTPRWPRSRDWPPECGRLVKPGRTGYQKHRAGGGMPAFAELAPMAALLLAIGAFAGVIAGLLGVGGGIILVPAFFYAFAALGYGGPD